MERNIAKIILTESQHNLLFEGLSSVLYHETNIYNLLNILTTNEFHLTAVNLVNKTDADKLHPEFFYMSTARSRRSHFFSMSYSDVIIELDGEKLKQKYKGRSVNFFKMARGGYQKEMEDRVVSYNKIIPNVISYIKNISILTNLSFLDKKDSSVIRKILLFLLKNKIPLFFYSDTNSILNGNTKNRLPISDVFLSLKKRHREEKGENFFYRNINTLIWLIEAYYKKSFSDLSEKAQKFIMETVKANFREEDFYIVLKGDFRYFNNHPNRFFLKLLKIFRKEKINTISEFIDLISKKWQLILQK